MKPNIFNIATKELSQDAFITWLLLWADPSNKNENELLNACGQNFIKELTGLSELDFMKVEAGRQWNNVDVWAEINDKHLIIIEDKTFTGEHSNQLENYKTMALEYANEKGMDLHCVYLKTGSESLVGLQRIQNKGYKVYSRKNLLDLLNKYKEIKNEIFLDFKDRMHQLEIATTVFESKLIKDWDGNCWQGLFQYLETNLPIQTCGWHYVNNSSGGFWNMCINWQEYKGFPVYFQLEQNRIGFKICTHPDEIDVEGEFNRTEIRNQWYTLLKKEAEDSGFPEIEKPERFGSGNYMTVAQIGSEHWLGKPEQLVDKTFVLNSIMKYDTWFKAFTKELK